MQVLPFEHSEDLTTEGLITMVRGALEEDCAVGVVGPVPGEELHRIATESVLSLWSQSRIKTFLPLLAVRHARERLQERVASRNIRNGEEAPSISITGLVEELDGTIDLRLTYTHDDQWHSVLIHRPKGETPIEVRVTGRGATMDEALNAVFAKARAVHSP